MGVFMSTQEIKTELKNKEVVMLMSNTVYPNPWDVDIVDVAKAFGRKYSYAPFKKNGTKFILIATPVKS